MTPSTMCLLSCMAWSHTSVCVLQHEAALTKAEKTLEEDTAAFDKFLKESDEKVQQAMSRADAEMKAKQEKVSSQEY